MKILIIRTLKSELIPNIIEELEKNFINASFNLLTHNNQESLKFFEKKFHKIYIYEKNKDFSIKNASIKMLKNLKNEKFDLIVLPRLFNTNLGFLDAIGLAFFIFPKKIAILPYKKELIYIKKNFLLKFITVKTLGLILNIALQLIFWPIFLFYFYRNKLKL
jgi:hypothetical protein